MRIGTRAACAAILCLAFVTRAGSADPTPPAPFTGYAWTASQPGNDNGSIKAIAMSADGSRILVAEEYGQLYVTSDSGATWSERQPAGDSSISWASVAMSADGSVMLAGAYGERLRISVDSGATWTETQPKGDANGSWIVGISADASTLVALETWGRAYLSTDLGANWAEVRPIGDDTGSWSLLALSTDGSQIVVGNDWGGLYRSTDRGATWAAPAHPADNQYWISLALSGDGTHILLGAEGSRLWRSTDGGASWTEQQPVGDIDQRWIASAISGDGVRMVVAAWDGGLYSSSDAGETWIERRPAEIATAEWQAIAVSADATRVVAAPCDSTLYLGVPNPVPGLAAIETAPENVSTVTVTGWVTDPGESTVISRGVCWNTTGSPTRNDDHMDVGTGLGSFTASAADLTPGTTYYFRTFAVNEQGTGYSSEQMIVLPGVDEVYWSPVRPAASARTAWINGALSKDGTTAIALEALTNKAYTTRDGGGTWEPSAISFEFTDGIRDNIYTDCDVSDDGATMLLTGSSARAKGQVVPKRIADAKLFLSRNAGQTWGVTLFSDRDAWSSVTVSPDGQLLRTVLPRDGQIWTSLDGGDHWSETFSDEEHNLYNLCSSDDGSRLLVTAGWSTDALLTSNDSGQTWTPVTLTGEEYLNIECSADGRHIYVAGTGVAISHDGGATWTETALGDEQPVACVRASCSNDGQTVLLGGMGRLFLSRDGGTTWATELYSPTDPLNDTDAWRAIWMTARVSGDGKRLLAGRSDGGLYVGEYTALQTVTTSSPSEITATSAMAGGSFDTQPFVPVTTCGVCWNTTGEPTLADSYTYGDASSDAFVDQLTGLTPDTTYHVRAYAISALGTVYGEQQTFKSTEPAGAPDLFVTVTSGDGSDGGSSGQPYGVGEEIRFVIRVGNRGSAGANGIVVRIPIPEGTEFVSAEPIIEPSGRPVVKSVTLEGNEVVISLPQLAPDEQVSIRLVLRTLVAGQVVLNAQMTSQERPTAVAAQPAAIEVVADDDSYYRIVTTAPLCGMFGSAPLLGLLISLGLMRRRIGG